MAGMTTQAPGTPGQGGFDVAMAHITDQILSGQVRPGDRLPPERELAQQLGISRGAVREAVRALQAQGLVTSQVGHTGGTRIASGQGESFGRTLRLHLALQSVSHDELTDTRVLLEREAVGTAASSATPEELAHLARLCDQMDAAETITQFNALDTDFHVGIAQAAQNRLLRDLTIAVRQALASHILVSEQQLGDAWLRLRENLIAEHRRILDALAAGDSARAADLVEEHVRRSHVALVRS